MPSGAIGYHEDVVVVKLLGQFAQVYVHALRVTLGHNEEEILAIHRIDRTERVPVFADIVTRHNWTLPFGTPTVLRIVYPPEPCFILKHQANLLIA